MCENAAVMFMSSTAVLGGSLAVNLLLKPYHQGGHVVEERDLNAGAEEEKEDEEFMERGEELVYLHAEDTKEGRTTADKVVDTGGERCSATFSSPFRGRRS